MSSRSLFRWVLANLFVALLVAASAAGYAVHMMGAPGPLEDETTVVIPRGAGVDAIGRRLAEAGVIEHRWLFNLAARLSRSHRGLRAGEYRFAAGISTQDVIEDLAEGRVVVRRLTVAEGLTTVEVLTLVRDAEGLSGAITLTPGEGTLMPETYHYTLGDSRDEIVRRMQTAMREIVAELWPTRRPDLPIKTPEEAVIVASIVEKETAVKEERPRVASVFVNRMRKGMLMQSDPTVVYAVSGGTGPIGRPLTRRDLNIDSPYNTYRYGGLPPGPIANPGRASLEATLNPPDTDLYYFVADGSGGHAFGRTLAEHNRNVREWRKIQRQRGLR